MMSTYNGPEPLTLPASQALCTGTSTDTHKSFLANGTPVTLHPTPQAQVLLRTAHLQYFDRTCSLPPPNSFFPNLHRMIFTVVQHHLFAAFILAYRLPLCSANAACSFIVYTERCCRNGSSQSGIAPELNWSQLYVICRCGQSSKVIDLLARRYLPLGHPWAASGVRAVVQISPSKRLSEELQASLKAASHFWLIKQSVLTCRSLFCKRYTSYNSIALVLSPLPPSKKKNIFILPSLQRMILTVVQHHSHFWLVRHSVLAQVFLHTAHLLFAGKLPSLHWCNGFKPSCEEKSQKKQNKFIRVYFI